MSNHSSQYSARRSALLAGVSAASLIAAFSLSAAQAAEDADLVAVTPVQTAQAETAPPAPTEATSAAASEEVPEADASEEYVVVGSRIRRDKFNSASPVQVITREETTVAGYSSTTEAIQGTSVTGGAAQINNAFGGFVTDGGPGANTISLRGLGAGRTLVLINGRRVAPAGTRGAVGSADLNVLPSAMIDRIEVLRDGASSIYGSDAIAGVINVITRTDIEGLTIEGQYNKTQHGGGDRSRLSLVGGASGDGWQISGSAEVYERTNLALKDRAWTRCNTDNFRDPVTGESLDDIDPLTGQPKCYPITGTGSNGVTINTLGTALYLTQPDPTYLEYYYTYLPGIVPAAGSANYLLVNRWRPNAGVGTGLPGFEAVGGFDQSFRATSLNVRDTFEPRMLNESLISPAKIYTGYLQGSYEIKAMGNAEVYAEVLANRRESEQIGYRQLTLDYRYGSPLIPEQLSEGIFSGPQATSGGELVGVRAFIGFGNDRNSQTVDYYKATGGIRGDLGFSDWRYDLTLSYAKSDAEYTFESFLTDKVTYATDAVVAPAGFTGPTRNGLTCAINLTNPEENCIVAPPVSSQTIGGILPQDFKDYIFRPVTGVTKYDEFIFSAQADGTLFEYADGKKVSAVFGLEYRYAEIDDTPPIDSQNRNLLNLTSATPTRGDDSVLEVFGELESTILEGISGVHELTLNVSGRFTDYDSYGSDWTYKVGGIYAPIEWFSLRATYGTSYRAPALFEQFQGPTTGFLNQSNDPCNDYTAPNRSDALKANCASEGLPTNFRATSGITVTNEGGAAAGLEAETSDNFTVGAIFQSDIGEEARYGELAVAVDYYNIEINNGVQQVGGAAILRLCYNDPDFRAGGGFCNLVAPRDPVTRALSVSDSFTNVSTSTVEGIDYNLRYEVDVYGGTILFNAEVTQYLEQGFQLFPTDELTDYNGILTQPKWTGDFDLSYYHSGFRVRYELEWVGSQNSYVDAEEDPETSELDLDVPDYFTSNLSVQYVSEEQKWSAVVGVRNLFDKDPPTISSLYTNKVGNAPLYSGYDYYGRQFFVNISKTF